MSGGMKAGGLALRLVLLTLLLGVGVLHTLGHAGAHGGVTAVGEAQPGHSAHAAPVDEAGAPADPHGIDEVVAQDDPRHGARAEGATVSDCFAVIPSGPWLLVPHCTATRSPAVGLGAFRAEVRQDPGAGQALSRLSVLRI